MNNFKEGDKIRIKNEVSSETHREMPPHFTDSMDRLKDEVLTFSYINWKGNIKTEEYAWTFHPDWVEPVKEFKTGDKIRIKDEVSSETHFRVPPHFTEAMVWLKDKDLTISGFTSRGYIEVENFECTLHPDWVEKATEWTPAPEDDFKTGDKIRIKDEVSSETHHEQFPHFMEKMDELADGDSDSILEEAQEILEGERDSDYGDPVANFNRISGIASSILNEDITPEQCVVVMMAVKLSREQYKHKRDNLVDLVAYTEIYNRIKEQNN